jgi:hypothetical protein
MTDAPRNLHGPPGDAPDPDGAAIDAYLDGELDAAARAAFEERLRGDAALRAEVELERRIGGRLRAIMAPPESIDAPLHAGAGASPAGAPGPVAGRVGPVRRVGPLLRIAAVLALAGVGAWLAVARPWAPPAAEVALGEVRQRMVAQGFQPAWVCGDDAEMLRYTRERLGTPMTIHPGPGVQLVGWHYTGGALGEHAQVLLATVDGVRSVVVMDRAEHDRPQRAGAAAEGEGLRLHRREVGGVVMYELSPRAEAAILPSVAVVR